MLARIPFVAGGAGGSIQHSACVKMPPGAKPYNTGVYAFARSADGSKLTSGGYGDRLAKTFSVQRGAEGQAACALQTTAAGLGDNVRIILA